MRPWLTTPILAIVLLAGLPGGRLDACCTAQRRDVHVQIADQDVIISWNAATKTQHFIRRASFTTDQGDFGFLVPTPGRPQLAEVSDDVFDRCVEAIRPRVERVTRFAIVSLLFRPYFLAAGKAGSVDRAAVELLYRQRVAGYDAAVLKASDAGALARWLGDNGYESRPELVAWLEPYIEAGWIITAFKLAADEEDSYGLGTRYAVRMSFPADEPIFPYRTPTDQHVQAGGGGLLRIFFVGDGRYEARLGDETWGARVGYAAPRSDIDALLLDAVPAGDLPAGAWLTVFESRPWPAASDHDLVFSAAARQEKQLPPPIIREDVFEIPVEPGILLLLIGGGIWWRVRRKGASARA